MFVVVKTLDSNDHGAPPPAWRKIKFHPNRHYTCDLNLKVFAASVFEILLKVFIESIIDHKSNFLPVVMVDWNLPTTLFGIQGKEEY